MLWKLHYTAQVAVQSIIYVLLLIHSLYIYIITIMLLSVIIYIYIYIYIYRHTYIQYLTEVSTPLTFV